MNYSQFGYHAKPSLFKGETLMEFKTKQIKDFMNLNYGIRSRREHFDNYENDNTVMSEYNSDILNEIKATDEGISDKPYYVYRNLNKMMNLNESYKGDKNTNIYSYQIQPLIQKFK